MEWMIMTYFSIYLSSPLETEPPREGVRRQDQLKRFSVKREHN
jgi:hypothetical protein